MKLICLSYKLFKLFISELFGTFATSQKDENLAHSAFYVLLATDYEIIYSESIFAIPKLQKVLIVFKKNLVLITTII